MSIGRIQELLSAQAANTNEREPSDQDLISKDIRHILHQDHLDELRAGLKKNRGPELAALIDLPGNASVQEHTLLTAACTVGDALTVEALLLAGGADAMAKGGLDQLPLFEAIPHFHCLRILLAHLKKTGKLADILQLPNKKGLYALHYAAEGDHKQAIDLLLLEGADRNAPDFNGRIPVEYAKSGWATDKLMPKDPLAEAVSAEKRAGSRCGR